MMLLLLALLACNDDKPATTGGDVKTPPTTPTTPATAPADTTPPAGTAADAATAAASIAANPKLQPPKYPVQNADRMAASHVLVSYRGAVGAAPTIKRTKEEARARAEEALQKAKAGEDFGGLARAYSDDPSADRGGYLGGFGKGVMVEPFEMAVRSMAPGGISSLVETPFGFHVIRREPLAEVHAAHMLVSWKGAKRAPAGINRTKEEAKARAEEALAKVAAGDNWAKIVETYSDAPLKDDGGDLGWLARGQIDKQLESALFDVAPGACTPLIETPIGYHVLKRME